MTRVGVLNMTDSSDNMVKRLKEYFLLASVVSSVIIAMVTFVWAFTKNEVVDNINDMLGLESAIAEISFQNTEQTEAIRQNTKALEGNTRRLSILENTVTPDVAIEVDQFRSFVQGPCKLGESCGYVIRVRRTDWGEPCSAPTVLSRTIVDSSGNGWSTETDETRPIIRVQDSWTVFDLNFIVPDRAALGPAQYVLSLRYQDCGPERNASANENIGPLPFIINEADQFGEDE